MLADINFLICTKIEQIKEVSIKQKWIEYILSGILLWVIIFFVFNFKKWLDMKLFEMNMTPIDDDNYCKNWNNIWWVVTGYIFATILCIGAIILVVFTLWRC